MPTVLDAARVDGASPVQRFFFVTLPLMTPTIMVKGTTNRKVIVTMANTSARVRMAMAAIGQPISAPSSPTTGSQANGS